jgi:hypothetical protein
LLPLGYRLPKPKSTGQFVTWKISERPWYIAITASAGLHLGLVLAAGWIAVGVTGTVRPADVEASWVDADSPDAMMPASTPLLEISSRPEAGGDAHSDKAERGVDRVSSLDHTADHPSRLAIHLPTTTTSLTTNWLAESRSAQGLTDIVGPVVYGQDGRPEGQGENAGSGGGSGGGLKSSFFGVHTAARRVVYVVDASSSMNRPYKGEAKTRFGQMKLELAKSVLSLKAEQQFFIIFFNEHSNPMPADGMENAYPQNQQRYLTWVAGVRASGLTDPRPSIALALSLNPDVLYLLTDGTFPRDVQSDLGQLRQRSVQINTIAFGDPKAEKSLKSLALKNRGRFAFVP